MDMAELGRLVILTEFFNEKAEDLRERALEECWATKEGEMGLNPKAVVDAARTRAALVENFMGFWTFRGFDELFEL